MVCNVLGWGRDSKVVYLLHEKDLFAKDEARVDAWFMNCWREANVPQDPIDVLFPESWGLEVALHCAKHWYYVAIGD